MITRPTATMQLLHFGTRTVPALLPDAAVQRGRARTPMVMRTARRGLRCTGLFGPALPPKHILIALPDRRSVLNSVTFSIALASTRRSLPPRCHAVVMMAKFVPKHMHQRESGCLPRCVLQRVLIVFALRLDLQHRENFRVLSSIGFADCNPQVLRPCAQSHSAKVVPAVTALPALVKDHAPEPL